MSLVTVNPETGALVWDTTIAPEGSGFGLSGGPLVARGKVMQGINGQAPGGAYIVGLDAETGAVERGPAGRDVAIVGMRPDDKDPQFVRLHRLIGHIPFHLLLLPLRYRRAIR